MKITWIRIKNIKEYIDAVMSYECEDIPKEVIDKGTWIQEVINIDEIMADKSMLESHDAEPAHIERKDRFVKSIKNGMPLLPLILLKSSRGEKYLVDGYARFRAINSLGIKEISVLKQIFED